MGKAKEEELINRYLNKEQYYLGKLTVDIMERQQTNTILEISDGVIDFIKKYPWVSALLGAGAGGAGTGLAQTTAGTVEVVVSEATAVSAIEIVAAGAVIGTLVVAAATHNNSKSQDLQNENSEKLDEAKDLSTDNSTAKIGDVFGKMGKLTDNPNLEVDWSNTTQHGIDRMLQRGVTQDMVNEWVENGKVLQQSNGSYIYITKDGVAVLSKDGRLVTTYPSSKYDDAMKEIIKKLFGN